MKKQPKERPIMIKKDKSTIIVLAFAAVIFFGALFCIYSKDILNGAGDIFAPTGTELVEYEKATVKEILSEDLKVDDAADGAYSGQQELNVIVKSGQYKGEEMVVYNYVGPLSGVPVEVGDSVTLTVKTQTDGEHFATVYEFNRIPILIILTLFPEIVPVL